MWMNMDTVKTIAFEGRCALSFFDQIDEVNPSSDDSTCSSLFVEKKPTCGVLYRTLPSVVSVFLLYNCFINVGTSWD